MKNLNNAINDSDIFQNQILGKEDSSFESFGNEIHFRLSFDINPYEYPHECPFVSVLASKSILNPKQKEKFQTALVEFTKELAIGRLFYFFIEEISD